MKLLAVLALAALPAFAKEQCKEATTGLAAKAKISCDAARKAALAKVKHAHVKSSELEEEKGRLVYSFDLGVKGDQNTHEVQVDALTGEVVSVQVEDAAAEAAEKAADAKEHGQK